MKELVEVIAKALVEHPDQVQVTEKEDGRDVTIELRVAPSDMGKVIYRRSAGVKGNLARLVGYELVHFL